MTLVRSFGRGGVERGGLAVGAGRLGGSGAAVFGGLAGERAAGGLAAGKRGRGGAVDALGFGVDGPVHRVRTGLAGGVGEGAISLNGAGLARDFAAVVAARTCAGAGAFAGFGGGLQSQGQAGDSEEGGKA